MTLEDAIFERQSIRRYISKPLPADVAIALRNKIDECNRLGNLNIQLVTNEPKGFSGIFAYGKFSGVTNYLVITGKKDATFEERVGYYGEMLVLYAQTLGLNTCWAGLSYRKVANTFTLREGDSLSCMIALGYGEPAGPAPRKKALEKICNCNEPDVPDWFISSMKAVQQAPSAINQQKYFFEYCGTDDNGAIIKAHRRMSLVGYTQMDLGIAKLHFELATKHPFHWAE